MALYQGWSSFDISDSRRLIEGQADREAAVPGTWLQLAIIESASGRLIGDCGLHCLEQPPLQFELGITLAPDAQRHGYATETVERLLTFLFAELDAHRVIGITDVRNHRAAALFRRLGFRREALFVDHLLHKGRLVSEFTFAMLKKEWEERHNSVT